MFRSLLAAAVVVAILVPGAQQVFAQDQSTWPNFPLPDDWRGPGFYLSWVKILSCWMVFLAWVWTTDWVSVDCQELKLDHLRWNPIVFGSFMAAFVLLWLLPYFWLGFPLLVSAYVAPLASYVLYRNSRVRIDQRVLTPEHLRYWLAERLAKVGIKIAPQRLQAYERGPPIKLTARGGPTQRDDTARLLAARQAPGFRDARQVIADGLSRRAVAITLEFTPQAVAVRHQVDGVWLDAEPLEREIADPLLEALKTLCGLNPKDRQKRQEGTFTAEYQSISYLASLVSQGVPTGERALIQFEVKQTRFESLDELGMRSKMQEQLRELLALPAGLLLFSAVPAGGLRSTMNVVLRTSDRLTRDFAALEEETKRYEQVENVPVTTYNASQGEAPGPVLIKLFRTEPDVVVVRDLVDAEMVRILCKQVSQGRLIISTIRAQDCAEALLRVLALKVPPAEFARAVSGVLNQRLVRKLCEKCKEAYTPTPQVLQQLNLPQGRVQALYRPPQQPKDVCPECRGVGYKGRTAIFELLVVNDAVRKLLATTPKLDLLRQAARKGGMHGLHDEGLSLLAKGITSLPELMRVLKS